MIDGEVRIYYAGRGTELDETFQSFMVQLGYEQWAEGFPMGERELCFIPSPAPTAHSHIFQSPASENEREGIDESGENE